MVTPKASGQWASRLSQRCWRNARGSTHRHQWPRLQRRTYASAGEGSSNTHKSGSDLPWAITSIVITVPATYYLLQPQIERLSKPKSTGHGHGDHSEHKEHGDEKKPEEQSEESKETEAKPEAEESSADEGSSDDEKPTEEEPKSEGEEKPSEPTEEASDGESGNEESKGKENEDNSSQSNQAGKQKGKQSGLSNAETRHSTDITGDTGKSKKGEGSIETSKTEGTVDPARPAR